MNPLTNMKNVTKLSEQELNRGSQSSWHDQYRDSAWIFIGGLPFDLTEGDIICIFSQYGEVTNINLIRAKDTGKSKGFCFLCYEDQRSTVLAVDNLNGIKILNRLIRVDHVANYKVPKESKKTDEETKKLYAEGCAPKPVSVKKSPPGDYRETIADQIEADIKLPPRLPIYPIKTEPPDDKIEEEVKVKKEKKKKRKKEKKKKRHHSDSGDSSSEEEKHVKRKRDSTSSSDKGHKSRKEKDSDRQRRSSKDRRHSKYEKEYRK